MINKIMLMCLMLLVLSAGIVFAQDDEGTSKSSDKAYVDIESANRSIASLQAKIDASNKNISALEVNNNQLTEENNSLNDKLTRLNALLEKVTEESRALYDYSINVIDGATKDKANKAYQENERLRKKLEGKKAEILNNIDKNESQIESNNEMINFENLNIKRFNEEIDDLKTQIANSNEKGQEVDGHITTIDSLKSEAAEFFIEE